MVDKWRVRNVIKFQIKYGHNTCIFTNTKESSNCKINILKHKMGVSNPVDLESDVTIIFCHLFRNKWIFLYQLIPDIQKLSSVALAHNRIKPTFIGQIEIPIRNMIVSLNHIGAIELFVAMNLFDRWEMKFIIFSKGIMQFGRCQNELQCFLSSMLVITKAP